MGHAQLYRGRMKDDDPEIDATQTSKHFDGRLALLDNIRKIFTDSIPNNEVRTHGAMNFQKCEFSLAHLIESGFSLYENGFR